MYKKKNYLRYFGEVRVKKLKMSLCALKDQESKVGNKLYQSVFSLRHRVMKALMRVLRGGS